MDVSTRDQNRPAADTPIKTEVAIIGAGFSGMGMAIKLIKARKRDFLILEAADDIGGTWRANTYPGCGCDVVSHLYSYSFEPNPHWSRRYGGQQEIWDYMQHCATKYGLKPHVRFNTKVASANWIERDALWELRTHTGDIIRARKVVSGVGLLRIPSYPELKGIENFRGKTFHSTHWDHDYDFTGKSVAVIGTGASAIQFVPQIQPKVARLHLIQRSPPWILPKQDRPMKPWEQKLFKLFPLAQKAFRLKIFWYLESKIGTRLIDLTEMHKIEALGRLYLDHVIKNPEIRAKVEPSYRLGCKRILLSNDYYPAIQQPNVELVTGSVTEVRENSIVTDDGVERPVDAIIYGTGFKASDFYSELDIVGRNGLSLKEAWKNGPEAYFGIAVSGFPNWFMLHGPNIGTGHNSAIFMIEAQVRYIMQALKKMDRRKLASLEVKPEVQQAFNQWVQDQSNRAVWGAGGCHSWYLGKHNKNTALWPGLTIKFWRDTFRMRLSEFKQTARSGA